MSSAGGSNASGSEVQQSFNNFNLNDNHVGTCCFCIPLKIGVLIIAACGIFFSFIDFGISGYYLNAVDFYLSYFPLDGAILLVYGLACLFAGLAFLVACVLLIFAVVMRKDLFYKIWIIVAIICVVLSVIGVILVIVYLARWGRGITGGQITYAVWSITWTFIALAIRVYFILVVMKARKVKDQL